jgi:broad specificity phosphatase PhoE
VSIVTFITHPEVVIDPLVPVPRWHLSDVGIAKMRAFAGATSVQGVKAIWASTETKAIEAAGILAAAHGLPVSVHPGLDENDRSATGFLPPDEFQRVADTFFANPHESVRGWERAIDAQRRVFEAFDAIVAIPPEGDIAIVAHGGVGTLLYCHLLGLPIDRRHDQPAQGHFWSYALQSRSMIHAWRSITEI